MSQKTQEQGETVLRKLNSQKKELGIILGTVLGALLVWELLSLYFSNLDFIFVPIQNIVSELVSLPFSSDFRPSFMTTVKEIAAAVVLAVIIGVPFGVLLGRNEFVAKAVEPLVFYFSSVPKIVIYPVLLIIFGVGIESKIAKGFISALFPIFVNTITGVQGISEPHVNVARMYQASLPQRLLKVYLPSTITPVINGIRLGASVAVISVILGELFASQQGLGNLAQFYFRNTQMAKMYTIILIIFIMSLLINLTLMAVQRYLARKGYKRGGDGDLALF